MIGGPRSGGGGFLLILSLLFGLYMINVPLQFVPTTSIPESITSWIILVGGVVLIIQGIRNLFTPRYY